MSIPLDQLYHFLHSFSDGDMIIYHWYPHGSRKLEDLIFVQNREDVVYKFLTPHAVFHDQEPLNYNYWSKQEFCDVFFQRYPETMGQEMASIISNMHIRSILNCPFNLYQKTILVHSEQNSKELEKYINNNFVGVYYWCHALIALDWFRYAQHDKSLCPDTASVTHDFLIYNRAWSGTREYRLKFSELLIDHNLTNQCWTKFNPIDCDLHYTEHVFKNPLLSIGRSDMEKIYSLNHSLSNESANYNSKDYKHCGIEVILETLFDDNRWHLTEKTLRPIACGRPFMLAATPGSLKYLKSYGFKTFSPLINEEYDSIVDPLQRLVAIVKEMQRINDMQHQDKIRLWTELNKIADYNKNLFFSSDWCNNIVKEFQTNLSSAYTTTVSRMTDSIFRKYLSLRPYDLDCSDSERLKNRKHIIEWAEKNIK